MTNRTHLWRRNPQLSKFVNLEILVLKNCGLRRLTNFVLPSLRWCDLSSNDIAEANTVLCLADHSPDLEAMLINDNPVRLATLSCLSCLLS